MSVTEPPIEEIEKPVDITEVLTNWTKVSDAAANLALKNRRQLIWLKIIMGIVVCLVIAVGALTLLYRDASQRADTSRCEAGNDYRKADKELWEFAVNLNPNIAQTPEQTATTEKFVEFINKKDKLLKC